MRKGRENQRAGKTPPPKNDRPWTVWPLIGALVRPDGDPLLAGGEKRFRQSGRCRLRQGERQRPQRGLFRRPGLGPDDAARRQLASAHLVVAATRCVAVRAAAGRVPSHECPAARRECGIVVLGVASPHGQRVAERLDGGPFRRSSAVRRVGGVDLEAQGRALGVVFHVDAAGLRPLRRGADDLAVFSRRPRHWVGPDGQTDAGYAAIVLLLLDYSPLGRLVWPDGSDAHRAEIRRMLAEKLPLLAMAVAASCLTMDAQAKEAMRLFTDVPCRRNLQTRRSVMRPISGRRSGPCGWRCFIRFAATGLSAGQVAAAVLLLALLSAAAIWQVRFAPWLFVGWLWYLGMLVPVLGIVKVGDQARADRYTYLPRIGIVLAVVWGLREFVAKSRWRRALAIAVSGCFVAGCVVLTVEQISVSRDSQRLWSHVEDRRHTRTARWPRSSRRGGAGRKKGRGGRISCRGGPYYPDDKFKDFNVFAAATCGPRRVRQGDGDAFAGAAASSQMPISTARAEKRWPCKEEWPAAAADYRQAIRLLPR